MRLTEASNGQQSAKTDPWFVQIDNIVILHIFDY